MNSNDRPEFVRVLNGLAAIKRVDLTKDDYELWWQSMQSWAIDDFMNAAGFLLTDCEFMPSPFDFEQLRKKGKTTATEAWGMALQHAEGGWRQSVLGDALIDQVVTTMGGYSVIALMATDKLGFLERRFKEMYSELLDTSHMREALPDLTERPRIRNGSPVNIGKIANIADK